MRHANISSKRTYLSSPKMVAIVRILLAAWKKIWVRKNINKEEIEKIVSSAHNTSISFFVQDDMDASGLPQKTPPLEGKNLAASKFYVTGYSKTNSPKPYAKKIQEPLGTRDDFKKDRAGWKRTNT